MRLWMWILFCMFPQIMSASSLMVTDIKVSSEDASPAVAREKALAEGHKLAFLKLIEEYYPASIASPPPPGTLEEMITTFSIDREKATAQGYSASLSFQFDESLVKAWLEKRSPSIETSLHTLPFSPDSIFHIIASYQTFEEWQKIKTILQNACASFKIISLSPLQAEAKIILAKPQEELKRALHKEALSWAQKGKMWEISPLNTPFSSLSPR